jgi:F0F1-type ATP synthase membrane subunit b/b'
VITAPNLSLLLIMACFWLVYLLVSKQFVKPLGAILDRREAEVRSSREAAAGARLGLDEALARCERELAQAAGEGQRARAALRAEGEAARRARLDTARRQGQERLAAFGDELSRVTEEARAALRAQGGELARTLAERLLGRRI